MTRSFFNLSTVYCLSAFLFLSICCQAPLLAKTESVSITEKEDTVTLDNGIVLAVFDTSQSENQTRMISLIKDNTEYVANGFVHFQMVANHYGTEPRGTVFKVIKSEPDMADIAFIEDTDYPFYIEWHYVLLQGEGGIYAYAIFKYDPAHIKQAQLEQMNWAVRPDASIYKYGFVDEERRNIKLPRPEELAKAEVLRPKEARRLADGTIDHKYRYSAMLKDMLVTGLTGDNVGLWVIQPSREDINGGPTHMELTIHQTTTNPMNHRMVQASHYSGWVLDFDTRDGKWAKLYGPWLLYPNKADDPNALWEDAKKKGKVEEERWPYKWLKNDLYVLERGSAEGQIDIQNAENKLGTGWVVLAQPEGGRIPHWQHQGKDFIFWAEMNKDGSFEIKKIRPGKYSLYAFIEGVMGEYRVDNIEIKTGKNELGTFTWKPFKYGKTLWQLGYPDRTAGEFRHGDDYRHWGLWQKFPEEFPYGVDFTIGESNERLDWNYNHCTVQVGDRLEWEPASPWKIRFNVDEHIKGKAYLRIAIAATRWAGLKVKLNERTIAEYDELVQDGTTIREGIQGYYDEKVIPFDAAILQKGENVISLIQPRLAPDNQTFPGEFNGIMYDCIRLEIDQK